MSPKVSSMKIKTAVLVTMLAGLSMGNESCQKANTRVLKMDVDLGTIAAQPVVMPSGERIDFAYVTNALFYQEVMANDHFVISNPIPTPTTSLGSVPGSRKTLAQKITSGLSSMGLMTGSQSADEKLIQDFGFADQLQRKAQAMKEPGQSKLSIEAVAGEMPACLYNLPQAKLGGEVVSFDTNFGAGLSIGYGANGSVTSSVGLGGSAQFTSTRLQMGLRAVDPLNDLIMAAAKGISNQSDVKFKVNILSALLGLDFFFKTPIASVVSGAIDKSLAAVVTDLTNQRSTTGSWGDAWESRVVYDPEVVSGDTRILIRGGTRYGMVVGDKFSVTNMRYKWVGEACTSALQYKVPITPTPVANVEIIAVGDNVAVATVTSHLTEDHIMPGAQVKLVQMFVAPTK